LFIPAIPEIHFQTRYYCSSGRRKAAETEIDAAEVIVFVQQVVYPQAELDRRRLPTQGHGGLGIDQPVGGDFTDGAARTLFARVGGLREGGADVEPVQIQADRPDSVAGAE